MNISAAIQDTTAFCLFVKNPIQNEQLVYNLLGPSVTLYFELNFYKNNLMIKSTAIIDRRQMSLVMRIYSLTHLV